MTLAIQSIANAGEIQRERLVLRATADADVGEYVVLMCLRSEDGKPLAENVPRAFWFPDRKIKKSDFVVLYSKSGATSEKAAESGFTSYFYYWESDSPLWTKETLPVLLRPRSNWTVYKETQKASES